ncbi:MAG TPA: DegT/DnrJ/EryC1/StrS family aminotransferase [Solirubrobacteraceae bacterium]|nr:DegT/DnrJ/EryC1/StrS family aminotransferase [Solirubrobacteraceae bacterium]
MPTVDRPVPTPFNDLRRAAQGDEELTLAVERVARSGRYLLGEQTDGLERELAAYLGVGAVVAVANGTDALELALTALAAPGEEVLTAANAGGYAAIAARRCGLTVRYVDVDERDLLLSPDGLQRAIGARTRVVVVTHLYGKMARVEEIRELCWARGVRVLEDCAQAIGARASGALAGSVGDAAAFSFYPTKNLGALGDGGAVATSDRTIAERVRRLRQYGWQGKYEIVEDRGGNSRLDEIQAAALRSRLPGLDGANRRRREIAARYAVAVSGSQVRMAQDGGEDYVAHLAVIRAPDRGRIACALAERGIGTAIHYPLPDHRQPVLGNSEQRLPVSERACEEVLSLPCFPELTDTEVEGVCSALRAVAKPAGRQRGAGEKTVAVAESVP